MKTEHLFMEALAFFAARDSMTLSPPSLCQQVLHSGLRGASIMEHSGEDGAKRRAAKFGSVAPITDKE